MRSQLKITDIARPQFKANPFPFYRKLRADMPVCRTKLLGAPTWLVTRYDDVVTVLRDERFVKDWWPRTKWIHRVSGPTTRNMLNRDGPDHLRLRTLVHKAFTPSLVEQLRGQIETVCNELLNKLEQAGRLDLMEGYALPIPLTIIANLLGIPADRRRRFHSLSKRTLSASTFAGVFLQLSVHKLLIRDLRKLIAERRREPQNDLISALVRAEEAGDRLNEEELVGMIMLLLIAGYETTVNLLGTGALALIEDPEQLRLWLDNPTVQDSGIEELLRYSSPLDAASARFAREDLQLETVTISRGDMVVAMLGSANHDETQFADPDTLDLSRNPNRHVAFGQGVHFCLGAPLARLEGQIALNTLFRRFPNLRLEKPREELRWRKSLIIRGLQELPVRRIDGSSSGQKRSAHS